MKPFRYYWYKFWASRNQSSIDSHKWAMSYEQKSLEMNLKLMNEVLHNSKSVEGKQ